MNFKLHKSVLILLAVAWMGCSHTDLYRDGKRIAHIEADIDGLIFRVHADGSTEFIASRVNHSLPTRAGGSTIGTAGAAVAASGLLGVIPK